VSKLWQGTKAWVSRGVYLAAFVAPCIALPAAGQERQSPNASVAAESPEKPDLAQITVTAEVLKQQIDSYVSQISGGFTASDDRPMSRWRVPICPLVAGLTHDDGQFVFDRLTVTLNSVDIPLGREGCRPNFLIVATADPQDF
jgi:hypothetical protein